MKKFNFTTLKLPFKKGEWWDADSRMFEACFTILGQFVEEELGKGRGHKGYRLHCTGGTDEKAIDLWLWYKKVKGKGWKSTEDDAVDKKLQELMKLRRTLWT